MKEYRIAVLVGEGIGPVFVSVSFMVLDRKAKRFGFGVSF